MAGTTFFTFKPGPILTTISDAKVAPVDREAYPKAELANFVDMCFKRKAFVGGRVAGNPTLKLDLASLEGDLKAALKILGQTLIMKDRELDADCLPILAVPQDQAGKILAFAGDTLEQLAGDSTELPEDALKGKTVILMLPTLGFLDESLALLETVKKTGATTQAIVAGLNLMVNPTKVFGTVYTVGDDLKKKHNVSVMTSTGVYQALPDYGQAKSTYMTEAQAQAIYTFRSKYSAHLVGNGI